jgi:hypothetical protein
MGNRGRRRLVAFPAFVPTEGVLKVDEFSWTAGDQVNADDVETHRGALGERELPEILGGETAQGVALVAVDGGFGGSHVPGSAGLHFDETEQGALPGDEIDVAGAAAGRPAPGNDDVLFATEEEKGRVFTLDAGGEVVWNYGPPALSRNSVEAGEGALHPSWARVYGLFHGRTIVGLMDAKRKSGSATISDRGKPAFVVSHLRDRKKSRRWETEDLLH